LVPAHPKFLILVGWLTWLSAYLGVLVRRYARAAPLPGLLGWVEKDKRPVLYKSIYLYMAFADIFTVTVLTLMLITFANK
jgi:hypothetical protein